MSTIDSNYEFVSFTGGFYFREQGEREKLNGNCDSNNSFKLRTNYSFKRKHQKGCMLHLKMKKIEQFFN